MRLRDVIKLGNLRYVKESPLFTRKVRREVEKKARRERKGRGPAKAKPKNWMRDRHKRRKAQKARRKQSWRK